MIINTYVIQKSPLLREGISNFQLFNFYFVVGDVIVNCDVIPIAIQAVTIYLQTVKILSFNSSDNDWFANIIAIAGVPNDNANFFIPLKNAGVSAFHLFLIVFNSSIV